MQNEEKNITSGITGTAVGEEVKNFFSKDLGVLLVTLFSRPVDGTRELFTNRSEKSFIHSLILIAATDCISMVFVFLIIPGEVREYISWFTIIVRAASFSILFLILVACFSFIVRMTGGKPEFRDDLYTGALCGIPFSISVILIFLFSKIMLNEDAISQLMMGGYGSLISKGGVFLVLLLYTHLCSFNILFQSWKASGTKEAVAWYLSPLTILLSYYITFKIIV